MKTYQEYIAEAKTVKYSGHDYYGSPEKKVLARKSPSSSGGGGGGDLEETTKLSKIHRELKSGGQIGTVSPETSETNTKKEKKAAHKAIQKTLRKLSDKGMVSFTGPHKGRYKYSGTEEPAKEGSYILKPGSHPKARDKFEKVLKAVGSRFKQQSVLKVDKSGEGKLQYTGGEDKGKSEPMGKLRYNRKLETGSGDTQIKGKKASFTVQKD